MLENGEIQYITADHLGSPRVITNQQGEVISRRDLKPHGEDIPVGVGGRNALDGYGAQDKIRQRYTSYLRDDETGLDFAEARYYASTMGRFMSADPFMPSGRKVNPQTWNRYTYCINNPLKFIDPLGLRSDPANSSSDPETDGLETILRIEIVEHYAPIEVFYAYLRGLRQGKVNYFRGLGHRVERLLTTNPLRRQAEDVVGLYNTGEEIWTAYWEYADNPDELHDAVANSWQTASPVQRAEIIGEAQVKPKQSLPRL